MVVTQHPYALYLVTDDHQSIEEMEWVVRQAVAGGVTAVQLREKHGDVRAFIDRAKILKQALLGSGVPLIINDRVDVALAVDADGVHLGQSDMPATLARRLIGPDKILGLSIETEQQLADCRQLPIDYIGLSAIFPTPTKTNTKTHWGLAGLAQAVKECSLPVVAIGGLTLNNVAQVAATGCAGVALVSAICHSDNPRQASKQLLDAFHRL